MAKLGAVKSMLKTTEVAPEFEFPALSRVLTKRVWAPSVSPVKEADQAVVPVAWCQPVAL